MIRTLTAHTAEIDDVALAVQEILAQLDLGHRLLQHAVGIVTCYAEFLETGVVQALADALPFDIVGMTTLGNAVDGDLGQLMLGLSVLTSDEARFATVLSKPLPGALDTALEQAYVTAARSLPGAPALIIPFLPLINDISGDQMISRLDAVTGGIPLFGSVTVDHSDDYSLAYVIQNGQYVKDCLALLLIHGAIQPRFISAAVPEENIYDHKAVITAAQGNLLQEVNNRSVLDYLRSLGLLPQDGQLDGIRTIPFLIDLHDGGKPVARAIFALTAEGWAVCGGVMPLHAALLVGSIDANDVLQTSRQAAEQVLQAPQQGGVLMFSCIARNMALGTEALAELETVARVLDGRIPYQLAYSGGEICPVYDAQGRPRNRFHNDSIVVCLF